MGDNEARVELPPQLVSSSIGHRLGLGEWGERGGDAWGGREDTEREERETAGQQEGIEGQTEGHQEGTEGQTGGTHGRRRDNGGDVGSAGTHPRPRSARHIPHRSAPLPTAASAPLRERRGGTKKSPQLFRREDDRCRGITGWGERCHPLRAPRPRVGMRGPRLGLGAELMTMGEQPRCGAAVVEAGT